MVSLWNRLISRMVARSRKTPNVFQENWHSDPTTNRSGRVCFIYTSGNIGRLVSLESLNGEQTAFFIIYVVLNNFILMSFFVAILDDDYHYELDNRKENKLEMLQFLNERLRMVLPAAMTRYSPMLLCGDV